MMVACLSLAESSLGRGSENWFIFRLNEATAASPCVMKWPGPVNGDCAAFTAITCEFAATDATAWIP